MSKSSIPLPTEEPWAFFFDFDGTLIEIADRPEAVKVPRNLGGQLAQLAKLVQNAVAIVTGRRIAEIDRMLSPHHLDVAGVHGAELRIAQKVSLMSSIPSERFTEILAELHRRFGKAGLLIEDKGFAAAVHWRLQPNYEVDVLSFMKEASHYLGSDYRLQLGKKVAEILPASSSKDRVIELFLGSPAYQNRRPIFFGDDLTDESGFDLVNRANGISVRVGCGPTIARYRLPTAKVLRQQLSEWAKGQTLDFQKELA